MVVSEGCSQHIRRVRWLCCTCCCFLGQLFLQQEVFDSSETFTWLNKVKKKKKRKQVLKGVFFKEMVKSRCQGSETRRRCNHTSTHLTHLSISLFQAVNTHSLLSPVTITPQSSHFSPHPLLIPLSPSPFLYTRFIYLTSHLQSFRR